jgi:hypothetical protein
MAAKKTAESTAVEIPETVKVDEYVEHKGKAFLVRLPDGSVVTARSVYTFRHEGTHAVIINGTEHTIEVAAK